MSNCEEAQTTIVKFTKLSICPKFKINSCNPCYYHSKSQQKEFVFFTDIDNLYRYNITNNEWNASNHAGDYNPDTSLDHILCVDITNNVLYLTTIGSGLTIIYTLDLSNDDAKWIEKCTTNSIIKYFEYHNTKNNAFIHEGIIYYYIKDSRRQKLKFVTFTLNACTPQDAWNIIESNDISKEHGTAIYIEYLQKTLIFGCWTTGKFNWDYECCIYEPIDIIYQYDHHKQSGFGLYEATLPKESMSGRCAYDEAESIDKIQKTQFMVAFTHFIVALNVDENLGIWWLDLTDNQWYKYDDKIVEGYQDTEFQANKVMVVTADGDVIAFYQDEINTVCSISLYDIIPTELIHKYGISSMPLIYGYYKMAIGNRANVSNDLALLILKYLKSPFDKTVTVPISFSWQCPNCGLINNENRVQCQACFTQI